MTGAGPGSDLTPAATPPTAPPTLWQRILARKQPILIILVLVGALAFAAGWNPPTSTVHSFTELSDYSARRESGCTNSGDGCHGDDVDRMDFNAYHPETDCTFCHEYTGVGCIPCHMPKQSECTGCHDGSMPGASDCVRLSDSYPKGHYRESLHAAIGTDASATVRAAKGGKAKAACGDCHSQDLRAAHTDVPLVEDSDYGPEIGCGECHNDKPSGALQQVKNDWKQHRCEDCHGKDSQAPMHAADVATAVEGTGGAGCGDSGDGCHGVNDLHFLHPDEPATCDGSAAEGEPGCHDLSIESHEPTATACGPGPDTCHAPYVSDDYSHERDSQVHEATAQGGVVLVDGASGARVSCGSCHRTEIVDEHRRSHVGMGDEACVDCHNANQTTIDAVQDSWPEREGRDACGTCHDAWHGGASSAHTASQVGDDGVASKTACVRSGCHATADVRVLHSAVGCLVAGCHSSSGAIAGTKMTCGGTAGQSRTNCHTAGDPDRHDRFDAEHLGIEIGRTDIPEPGACVRPGCHPRAPMVDPLDLVEIHEDAGGCYGTQGCHTEGGPVGNTCGGTESSGNCHATRHPERESAHIPIELGRSGCIKAGCHFLDDSRFTDPYDLSETHRAAPKGVAQGCYDTQGCHQAGGPLGVTCGGTDPASSCHVDGTYHSTTTTSHAGIELAPDGAPKPGACICHHNPSPTATYTATDVRRVRKDPAVAVNAHSCYTTAGCHVAGGPTGVTCGGNDAAISCHVAGSFHEGHEATEYVSRNATPPVVPAEPGGCTDDGCHPTTNVEILHTRVGCDIPVCHGGTPTTPVACGGVGGYPTFACHNKATNAYPDNYHLESTVSHTGIELAPDGTPKPGACSCHNNPSPSATYTATDVRRVRRDKSVAVNAHSCHETEGCHTPGGPKGVTCGGNDPEVSCHVAGTFHADHTATEYATRNYTPPDIPAEPGACTDDGCHPTTNVEILHAPVGCLIPACHGGTPTTPIACGGIGGYPTFACHNKVTTAYPDSYHLDSTASHTGIERGNDGLPQAGACICHHNPSPTATYTATDVRRVRADQAVAVNAHSCHETVGCHTPGGPVGVTCGGLDGSPLACHSTAAQRSIWCVIPDRLGGTGMPLLWSYRSTGTTETVSSATATSTEVGDGTGSATARFGDDSD